MSNSSDSKTSGTIPPVDNNGATVESATPAPSAKGDKITSSGDWVAAPVNVADNSAQGVQDRAAERLAALDAKDFSLKAGRYQPKVGERVSINGALAEITSYSLENNLWAADVKAGNSIDRQSGHISNTRIDKLDNGVSGVHESELDSVQEGSSTVANSGQETIEVGLARTLAVAPNTGAVTNLNGVTA